MMHGDEWPAFSGGGKTAKKGTAIFNRDLVSEMDSVAISGCSRD